MTIVEVPQPTALMTRLTAVEPQVPVRVSQQLPGSAVVDRAGEINRRVARRCLDWRSRWCSSRSVP
jgi:hypothetical protein